MYVYFPGSGIYMSTIDPTFLMKESTLGTYSWFEAKLEMKLEEKLPKKNFNCKKNEYENVKDLVKIHEEHEMCILTDFNEKWTRRNKTCYPFILENFDARLRLMLISIML